MEHNQSIFLKNNLTLHARILPSKEVRISVELGDLTMFLPPVGVHDLDQICALVTSISNEIKKEYRGII